MKLTVAECTAVMKALNRATLDLDCGWGDHRELTEEEIEKRKGINRRAYLKVRARLESLRALEKKQPKA